MIWRGWEIREKLNKRIWMGNVKLYPKKSTIYYIIITITIFNVSGSVRRGSSKIHFHMCSFNLFRSFFFFFFFFLFISCSRALLYRAQAWIRGHGLFREEVGVPCFSTWPPSSVFSCFPRFRLCIEPDVTFLR